MTSESIKARRKFLRFESSAENSRPDPGGIHIAGLVVHARPENLRGVREGLERLSGAEVHAADPRGKLVVTLEAASDGIIAGLLNAIPDLPGVLACTLVHHHSEPGEEQASGEKHTA